MSQGRFTALLLMTLVGCAAPMSRSGSSDASQMSDVDGGVPVDAGAEQDAGPIATYTTCSYIGGLDRLGIWRKDEVSGECAFLRLVSPGGTWDYLAELDLPENWGVESARLAHSDSCDCQALGGFDGTEATEGSGSVTFDVPDGGYWPQAISMDVTLSFDGGAAVRFEATDLPVNP